MQNHVIAGRDGGVIVVQNPAPYPHDEHIVFLDLARVLPVSDAIESGLVEIDGHRIAHVPSSDYCDSCHNLSR